MSNTNPPNRFAGNVPPKAASPGLVHPAAPAAKPAVRPSAPSVKPSVSEKPAAPLTVAAPTKPATAATASQKPATTKPSAVATKPAAPAMTHVSVPVATLQAIHDTLAAHVSTVAALLPASTSEASIAAATEARLKSQK